MCMVARNCPFSSTPRGMTEPSELRNKGQVLELTAGSLGCASRSSAKTNDQRTPFHLTGALGLLSKIVISALKAGGQSRSQSWMSFMARSRSSEEFCLRGTVYQILANTDFTHANRPSPLRERKKWRAAASLGGQAISGVIPLLSTRLCSLISAASGLTLSHPRPRFPCACAGHRARCLWRPSAALRPRRSHLDKKSKAKVNFFVKQKRITSCGQLKTPRRISD